MGLRPHMEVALEPTEWRLDLLGDDREEVSIKESHSASEDEAIDRAEEVMVQSTAFATLGGGRSVNPYDVASNGNFDEGQPLFDTWH